MTRRLLPALLLLSLGACRPDQVEHLKDTKRIAEETANWEVKRIMPADLLHATRWAGDSLSATADTLLRRTLARELAAGGVARAMTFCKPETYPAVDSMARGLQATPYRLSSRPRNPAHQAVLPAAELRPDTLRLLSRPGENRFFYQRPIVLNSRLCLRCHGQVGTDISQADYALIQKAYPQDQASGYGLGQVMGAWQISFRKPGVAEFYTMKTRKKWKPHKF